MQDVINLFCDQHWHDAVIKSLTIDRQSPGHKDIVEMIVKWPNGSIQKVSFEDCYLLNTNMNFGVICEETIRSANALPSHKLIDSIKKKYQEIGMVLPDLVLFHLNTNSTNSDIFIIARKMSLKDYS